LARVPPEADQRAGQRLRCRPNYITNPERSRCAGPGAGSSALSDPQSETPSGPDSAGEPIASAARARSSAGGDGIWALAWPSIALLSLQSLMGVVDLVFVSSLGTEAVAAVAVATQLHFFLFSLLAAVSAGTVAVVAREWGRGNRDEVARAARCSIALSAVIGAVMLLAIPFSEPFVAMLGVAPGVAALSGRCLAILLAFSIPLAVEFTLSQALRGAGDMRTPLAIGAASIVLNAVGDYALIFGRLGAPELGAEGSAWASAGAYAAGSIALYWLWVRRHLVLPAGRWRGSLSRLLAWRMLRVGIPSALEQAAFQGASWPSWPWSPASAPKRSRRT
jgi:putative MATE family efflux protein